MNNEQAIISQESRPFEPPQGIRYIQNVLSPDSALYFFGSHGDLFRATIVQDNMFCLETVTPDGEITQEYFPQSSVTILRPNANDNEVFIIIEDAKHKVDEVRDVYGQDAQTINPPSSTGSFLKNTVGIERFGRIVGGSIVPIAMENLDREIMLPSDPRMIAAAIQQRMHMGDLRDVADLVLLKPDGYYKAKIVESFNYGLLLHDSRSFIHARDDRKYGFVLKSNDGSITHITPDGQIMLYADGVGRKVGKLQSPLIKPGSKYLIAEDNQNRIFPDGQLLIYDTRIPFIRPLGFPVDHSLNEAMYYFNDDTDSVLNHIDSEEYKEFQKTTPLSEGKTIKLSSALNNRYVNIHAVSGDGKFRIELNSGHGIYRNALPGEDKAYVNMDGTQHFFVTVRNAETMNIIHQLSSVSFPEDSWLALGRPLDMNIFFPDGQSGQVVIIPTAAEIGQRGKHFPVYLAE